MIRLNGEKLQQYDLNRTIEIIPRKGRTVEMVRFIRGRKPYMVAQREDGESIVADIPNVLLKDFGNINCVVDYLDERGHIVNEKQSFYVAKRAMPDGYVYEETETLEIGEGGGLPSGGEPNKQFVTDASGKTVWEDRLAWKGSKEYALLTLDNTQEVGSQSVPDGWTRTQTNMSLWEYSTTLETVGLAWVLDDLSAFVGNVVKVYQDGGVVDYTVAESDVTDAQIHCKITDGCFLKIKTDGTLTLGVEGNAATYLVNAYPMAIVAETIKPIDPDLIGGWKALGEGEPVKTALVDNVTVTFSSGGTGVDSGIGSAYNPFTVELTLGGTHIVKWGAEEYECIGKTYEGSSFVYIGNSSVGNDTLEDTGEPFCIVSTGTASMVTSKTMDDVTVSIYALKPEIIPVPDAYLVYQFPEEIKNAEHAAAVIAEMQKYQFVRVDTEVCFYSFYEGTNGVVFKPVNEPLVSYDAGMVVSSVTGNYPMDTSGLYVMQKKIPTVNDMMYISSSSNKKFKLTVSDDGTLSATEVT